MVACVRVACNSSEREAYRFMASGTGILMDRKAMRQACGSQESRSFSPSMAEGCVIMKR